MASSRLPGEPADRALRSLVRIRRATARGDFPPAAFARARALIGHFDNQVRWQALIAVGCWIRSDPDAVWSVVLERGRSRDKDMRTGVAVILLEHLLGHDFERYFPLLRKAVPDAPLLADTLNRCWAFGEAERHWWRVRRLLARVRVGATAPARGRAKPMHRR